MTCTHDHLDPIDAALTAVALLEARHAGDMTVAAATAQNVCSAELAAGMTEVANILLSLGAAASGLPAPKLIDATRNGIVAAGALLETVNRHGRQA